MQDSSRIPGGCGREAPHAMATRKRKKREGWGPEGKHVAFAANSPPPGPDDLYPRRWGIETGHRMPRQARMRTSGRDENVRTFCLVVSLMAHSARAMMHSDRRAGGDCRRARTTPLKMIMVLSTCGALGVRLEQRPPRRPPRPP